MALRILLIDDDEVDRRAVRRALREASLAVELCEAMDGATGLQLIRDEVFDCVLLDYRLPDMDGLHFLTTLSAQLAPLLLPMVMLTGQGSEAIAVEAMHQGAQDYLVKDNLSAATLRRSVYNAMEIVALRRQRQQAEADLARLNAALLRSNAELEQFAYVASHDLQEPLRQVACLTDLLATHYAGRLDATGEEYLRHIVDGTTRMQHLIQDLLAYARVARQELICEPTPLTEVLKRTLSALAVAVADTQAQVTWDALPTVQGHPGQLGQVFQNLLGNALKFHGAQPPRIHLAATREPQAWVVAVRDHGIGLAPQFAERIFRMFQRLHTSAEYTGTGIGLAICQKIVERHGGRIWVESTPGAGATFFFTIPDRE